MAQDPKEKEQKRKEDKARKDVKEKLIDSNPINKFIKKILPKKEKPKGTKTKTEKIRVKKDPIKQRRMGVLKMKEGGMLKTPNNPGLKKLPTEVRNKMGYMKKGGVVKKGHHRMPDGTIMKDSEHKKMKRGGLVIVDRNYLKGK